jgi:hypothetical protein
MYTLISIPAGMVMEAVVVQRTRDRMRLIAPGFSDALELRRRGQNWFMDGGGQIEFEFLGDFAAENRNPISTARVACAGSA